MQNDGGREGHFWRSLGDRPKKAEVIGVNRRTPSHARYNLGPGDGNLAAFMVDKVGCRAFHPHFHTAKASDEEVRIEVLATKLAVSDGLQSNLFLLGDDPADSRILDGFQFLSRDFFFGSILAGLLQVRRPQQTAYVVSAKWRVVWSGGCHEGSSSYLNF
jgi:hypothetical protein